MAAKRIDSWVVSDDFWARVEPLVPTRVSVTRKTYVRQPGAGRPPKPARQVFEAVVYVLRTGCQWKALPKERFGSASAVHHCRAVAAGQRAALRHHDPAPVAAVARRCPSRPARRWERGGRIRLGFIGIQKHGFTVDKPRNISNHAGDDDHPCFLPDSSGVLFFSLYASKR